MSPATQQLPIATALGHWLGELDSSSLPPEVIRACADTVIDTLALSIAAKDTDYARALRESWTAQGSCTVLGSDISHWDVRDMTEPIAEAHELVEHGRLGEADFRDFAFANAVRLHAGLNPDFFADTVVAEAAADVLATEAA